MRKGTQSIVKDLKLNTLSADSVLTVPFYPVALPATGSPGTIAYLASTSSLNYWTGTQWLSINAGPITVYSINNTGAAANSVISNGTGPAFVLKGISAADSTITVSSTSDNVTLSSNVLESIPAQSWKAGSGSSVGASQCVAIGDSADAGSGTGVIAMGYNVSVTGGNYGVVIGNNASSTSNRTVVLGVGSKVLGTSDGSIAIGNTAQVMPLATTIGAIVIGSNSTVREANAVCIGQSITVSSLGAIGIKANVGTLSDNSTAIQGSIGQSSTGVFAANGSVGNSSGNSVCIRGTVQSGSPDSIAIGAGSSVTGSNVIAIGKNATNSVPNTAVIGNSSSFVLGTPGLLQSGAQWGVIAQSSLNLPIPAGSSTNVAFGNVIYDPYSSAASSTEFTLQKATQMYHVTATLYISFDLGVPSFSIILYRYDSILSTAVPISTNSSSNGPSGGAGQNYTYQLSGITISSNSVTDYVSVAVAVPIGSPDATVISTVTQINIYRVN